MTSHVPNFGSGKPEPNGQIYRHDSFSTVRDSTLHEKPQNFGQYPWFLQMFYQFFHGVYKVLMIVFPPIRLFDRLVNWGEKPTSSFENPQPWTQMFSDFLVVLYMIFWITIIPLAIVGYYFKWDQKTVYILNFFGMICLTWLLELAMEMVVHKYRRTAKVLFRITPENAVRLIMCVFLLMDGYIRVVQAHMLGAILGNLLVITGFNFLVAGLSHRQRAFHVDAAGTSSSLLALAVFSLILPAGYQTAIHDESDTSLLDLSRSTSVVLLGIYVLYLIFSLSTHSHLFNAPVVDEDLPTHHHGDHHAPISHHDSDHSHGTSLHFPLWLSILLTCITLVLLCYCARFLALSVKYMQYEWNVSQTFIGLIVLPLIELFAFIPMALDDMDFVINVCVGSSMQLILLVTPILVLLGWFIAQPLTLFFELFETSVLFMSVIIFNYVVIDGNAHWLEGAMLLCAYLLTGMAFAFYPTV